MGLSTIEMKRGHALPVDEAKRRLNRIAGELNKKYGIETAWNRNDLEFQGKYASGRIRVKEEELDVFVDLSVVLMPFKANVKKELRASLERDFV